MKHRVDRRVQRTRKALQEALLSLIMEKRYNPITVEEIAERANVGRTTFYLHYQDKDDLLLEVTGDFADEVQEAFLVRLEETTVHVEDVAAVLFNLAEEHSDMYWAIISGRCGSRVLEQFRKIFVSLFKRIIQAQVDASGENLDMPVGFIAAYLWGAMRETLIWWKEQGSRHRAETMVQMFNRLSEVGTQRVLAEMHPTFSSNPPPRST
ncbi:MAG: TetR/AcrR family transcriptional regulator [Anaerolineae bacterium]